MNAKEKLHELGACGEAVDWVGDMSIEEAWEACPRGNWMLWYYGTAYPEKTRELTLAAGHCANTVRHLMTVESQAAVDAAISFGEGKISREELKKAGVAANHANHAAACTVVTYTAHAAAACAAVTYTPYAGAHAVSVAAHTAHAAAYDAGTSNAARNAAKQKNCLETAEICRKYLKLGN